jgi:hypothetical protein
MSDGKLAGLHQRYRCVHHCGRQKATTGGKLKRQIATNSLPPFAAFCRSVSPPFFPTNSLGDGVFDKLPADKGKTNARYLH